MTATAAPGEAPGEATGPGDGPATDLAVHWRRRLVSRAVVFGAALAVAGWRVELRAVGSVHDHSPYSAFLLAPLAAAAVALWRQQHAGDELDVHDRHVDFTIAVLLAGLALGLSVLLSRRLGTLAPALGLEMLALPLWAAAAGVALFGTRPTRRHLYSLLVLALAWPLPFNVVGALVPVRAFASFVAATILSIACGGILAGPPRRVTLAVTAGVTTVIVAAHAAANPAVSAFGVAAVLATARLTGLQVLPRPSVRALWVPRRPGPAVGSARLGVAMVACLAVAAALTPSPAPSVIGYPTLADSVGRSAEATMATCANLGRRWVLVSRARLGDPDRLGAFVTTRCRYRDASNPPSGTVAVDLSDPEPVNLLAEAPFDAAYRTPGAESPLQYLVALPRGIGTLVAYDSASLPLTTVVVTGLITSATLPSGDAQRYAIIVTDDPLSSSPLPSLAPHLASASLSRLSEIMRISPQQARLSTAEPKNADLAQQLARVVVTQWESE